MQHWLRVMRLHEEGLLTHSLHVANVVTDYTRFCGYSYKMAWMMIEGALLHDVGKTQLPATILTKAQSLDEAERSMMVLHPAFGAALLEAEQYYDESVIAIVKRHHERLDGSGYPDRLDEANIDQAVRIVAVCEAFCAMTERRPYENAWPTSHALARLQTMPAQYDQEVVGRLAELIGAKDQGWGFKDTTLEYPVDVLVERKHPGLIKPQSAFYEAVYPITVNRDSDF